MNRPSRTEDDLVHPTWNQNPPFLAPDLTTCEDMNGMANARALRGATRGSSAAFGLLSERAQLFSDNDVDTDGYKCLPVEIVPLRERLHHLICQLVRSKAWTWTWWAVSVLVTSAVLSSLGLAPHGRGESTDHATPPRPSPPPLAIYRRSDACESGGVGGEAYDVPLHVGALVIIMSVSTLACMFPMLAKRFPVLRIPRTFFFIVRHFGTGVLIATAFIHLLPTAFISLGNPCLSTFWTNDYPAMPGAIALAGVFFVVVIEMVFSPARQFAHCRPGASALRSSSRMVVSESEGEGEAGNRSRVSLDDIQVGTPDERRSVEMSTLNVDQLSPGAPFTPGDAAGVGAKGVGDTALPRGGDVEVLTHGHVLTPEQKMKKEVLQCVLLEIGILFHSVFIGMALSVAVGNQFVVLLIAIAFHQTFEGMALGSRIADIDWTSHPQRPWFMALAYGLTTPIGQAIGLATHSLYNPDSAFGLVLVGTMNAISSGLLVYASLVELLAVDFLSDESWETLRGKRRVVACLIVLAGAFSMGLVGAWA
ncbi:related to plasma membrane zinc ion transporter [Cephalotrichum gorgonifer]|uniref:Related to plasma membrane zinc ion transporter n=1 Tax=Cephalotrichum gorgonifer TaxID=2041049 RepID=A0AAE8SY29_9PEZI|nr:related to plasma membrane zinc ion transporter [Cephalotrichum gorgonifer]